MSFRRLTAAAFATVALGACTADIGSAAAAPAAPANSQPAAPPTPCESLARATPNPTAALITAACLPPSAADWPALVEVRDVSGDGVADLVFADPKLSPLWRHGAPPELVEANIPGFAAIAQEDGTYDATGAEAIAFVESWCAEAPITSGYRTFGADEYRGLACALWRGADPNLVGAIFTDLALGVAPPRAAGGRDIPMPFFMGAEDGAEFAVLTEGLPALPQSEVYYDPDSVLAPAINGDGCLENVARFLRDLEGGRPQGYAVTGPMRLLFLGGDMTDDDGAAEADALDLDGDGQPEIVGKYPWDCGSHGCEVVLLLSNSGCLHFGGNIHLRGGIHRLGTVTNGMPDFETFSKAGGAFDGNNAYIWRFIDGRYQLSETLDCGYLNAAYDSPTPPGCTGARDPMIEYD